MACQSLSTVKQESEWLLDPEQVKKASVGVGEERQQQIDGDWIEWGGSPSRIKKMAVQGVAMVQHKMLEEGACL